MQKAPVIQGFLKTPVADAPHAPEHALEVELPFLQTALALFEVLPLVIGDASPSDVAQVLRRLWGGPETLIVVSSDLSHYHSYETARRLGLGDCHRHRARGLGWGGPRSSVRLPRCGRLASGSRAPRPQGSAACPVQFRRHGRGAPSSRWVRCLGI
jgi:hypothetical protein